MEIRKEEQYWTCDDEVIRNLKVSDCLAELVSGVNLMN